jgi:hypothetical protein
MGEKGMESQATSTATRAAVPNEALRAPSAASAATTAPGNALTGGVSQTGGGAPTNAIKEAMSRVAEPPKG